MQPDGFESAADVLFLVVAAQGALGVLYRDARRGGAAAPWPWALLFWAAQGAGLLIKGPITPLMSLLTAGPRTASVRATTSCDLFVLDQADFHRALKDAPQFASTLRQVVQSRYPKREGEL